MDTENRASASARKTNSCSFCTSDLGVKGNWAVTSSRLAVTLAQISALAAGTLRIEARTWNCFRNNNLLMSCV